MASPSVPLGSNERPFRNLGEQLKAIAISDSRPGAPPDPRLLEVEKRAVALGGSEQAPSDGGFLVDAEFSRDIVKRMYLTGQILRRCTQMPMTGSALKFPQFQEASRAGGSRLGGVQFFYESEAAALVAVKPAFQLSEMQAKKITGLINVTDELSQDSDALNSWASYAFAQESTFKLEGAIINGTGAGMPSGVLNSPALVTVAKSAGQSSPATTIVNDNITGMRTALWAASRPNAVWLYNGDLLPQLGSLVTSVGTGGSTSSLWHWAEGGEDTDRLAGIPAYPSEYCQASGTIGDLILADFSRYIVGMREQRTDVSIHVNFISSQQVFRFVMRVDGQVIDQAPVTPDHGTTATSPMVALASR